MAGGPKDKMETPKKLTLKISRKASMSSNGPASASQNENTSFFSTPPVATPDAMSPPTGFPGLSIIGSSALDSAAMPPPAVPPTPTDGKPKLKLKLNKSQPSTPITDNHPNRTPLPARTPLPMAPPLVESPASSTPSVPLTITKSGRTTKPTAKKRAKADYDTDEEKETKEIDHEPAKKKAKILPLSIKLKNSKAIDPVRRSSTIKLLPKDTLRTNHAMREPGSGFDSEMEDVEPDPITEEEVVLRMMEGPECDYINECLNSKKFPSGGMDFKLKWVDERRAVVIVQGRMFAAVLVDLPTITEATKTWDKKLVLKSADVCQMLLVFASVKSDAEAKSIELPKVLFDGYRWPHGLTPPMHDAVHRRFRKRLHKNEILNKEQEVQRLLEEDRKALSTRIEWVDERQNTMPADTPNVQMLDADGDEDAEGEVDEVYEVEGDGVDMTELEAELQRELERGMLDEIEPETPAQGGDTPVAPGHTPAIDADAAENQGDEDLFGDGESGEDYDDDEEDSDEDLDPAERERREQVRGIRDEVKDIDRQIEKLESQMAAQQNPLLRKRLQERLKGLNEDKRLKLASIGEVPPEDEEDEE